MAVINKKLINFASKANFDTRLANGDIDNRSIIFINDTKQIWTHGTFYDGSTNFLPLSGGTLTGDLNTNSSIYMTGDNTVLTLKDSTLGFGKKSGTGPQIVTASGSNITFSILNSAILNSANITAGTLTTLATLSTTGVFNAVGGLQENGTSLATKYYLATNPNNYITSSASITGSSGSVAVHATNEVNIGGSYTGGGTLYVNYADGGTFTNYSFYGGNTTLATLTASSFIGNASSATYASTVTLTADNTTNATNYPLFVNAATGNLSPRTDTAFTFNPSSGLLTTTSVSASTLVSTVASGTAPLTVASTTLVSNLNADMLDGYHASSFTLINPNSRVTQYNGGLWGQFCTFTTNSLYNGSLVLNFFSTETNGYYLGKLFISIRYTSGASTVLALNVSNQGASKLPTIYLTSNDGTNWALSIACVKTNYDPYVAFAVDNSFGISSLAFSNTFSDITPSGSFYTGTAVPSGSVPLLTTARTITIGSTGRSFDGSGNITWSLSDIGAAASVHTHVASDITSGIFDITRIPTGTTSTTVALGNHTHSYLPLAGGVLNASGYIGLNGGTAFGIGVLSENRNAAVFDTIESVGSDPLELNYYQGGPVKIGSGANGSKSLYAVGIYDNGNQVLHAGNYSSYALPLTGGNVTGTLGFNSANTARMAWRPAGSGTLSYNFPFYLNPTTGSINIEVSDNDTGGLMIDNEGVTVYGAGDSGYVFRVIDEDQYQANGNNVTNATQFWVAQDSGTSGFRNGLTIGGNTAIHAGNYNSYSPTLTGTGATGTWGINVTGYSTQLSTNGGLTTAPGTGKLNFTYHINNGTTGLFSASDNSNAIITLNRHDGAYDSQLGFSSNGNVYYRNFSAAALDTTTPWRTIWDSGNDGSGSGLDADLLDGLHQSSFLRCDSASSGSPLNANFAIGVASSRNFIQSHSGYPLDLNPLGNTVTINGYNSIHAGNIGSQSVNFANSSTTSTKFASNRTNYRGVTDDSVAGQLMWKNYGNNHTIFDASNSTAPDGTSINNTNSTNAWSATYPTLMGWNGSATYGVRVDSARIADIFTTRSINGVNFNGSANIAIGSLYDATYTFINNPGGAQYTTGTSTLTGAIAITLPVGYTSTMVRMTIKVYEYATNKSFEIHVGGYNSSAILTWAYNPFAYIVGNPGMDRRFTVRLGYNSTSSKTIVYIGELASTWSYPQIFVTDLQCGYGGQSSTWTTGWSIGFEATAFQNVTATISNCQVGYSVSTNTANSVVLRDGSGNFSAGTITASLTGTASIASTVTLTADNSTNATNYPLFVNAATGNLSPRTDTGFTYNPSTGVLTSTTFSGALSGNASTASALALHSSNEVNIGGGLTGGGSLYINYNDGGSFTNYNFYGGGTSLASITAGAVVASSTITATGFYESSDLTLKTNVQTLDDNVVDLVFSEDFIKSFDWKSDRTPDYGVIAQHVETYFPHLVTTNLSGSKHVKYNAVLSLITGAAIKKIKSLEDRITKLENK